MSGIDKFLDFLKIERDDDFEDEYEVEDIPAEKPKPLPGKAEKDEAEEKPFKKPVRPSSNNRGRKGGVSMTEITRIKPTGIEDGRKITNFLLDGRVVFLDLEGIDMALAQRIIDYVSGANYAMDGTLQQMSKCTFVIAPPGVSVSGDFPDSNTTDNSIFI